MTTGTSFRVRKLSDFFIHPSVRIGPVRWLTWLFLSVCAETSPRLPAPRGSISTLKPNTVCNSRSVTEQLRVTGSLWQKLLHVQTYVRTYVTTLITAFHELQKLVACKDGDSEGNGVRREEQSAPHWAKDLHTVQANMGKLNYVS